MIGIQKISCVKCQFGAIADAQVRLRLLQSAGHLLKVGDPSNPLVQAMFDDLFASLACPTCQSTGSLRVDVARAEQELEDDDAAWGGTKKCRSCKKPIARERIAALPTTELCVVCAAKPLHNTEGEEEFCSRCGNVLTLRDASRTGRYSLHCRFCGR